MADVQETTAQESEVWRVVFADGHPALRSYQDFNKKLPRDPRCKLCAAPFRGWGSVIMRFQGREPSSRNPRYCSRCDSFMREHPGGAEVEMSLLFVDVRNSMALAEKLTPTQFGNLMNQFYANVTKALFDTDGFIDKFVGDAVIGLYPPGMSGPDHAKLAVQAAQQIVRSAGGGSLPVGVGVHTGLAYIGTVGGAEGTSTEITALGDNVNIADRLASVAGPGEALISDATWQAAGLTVGDGMPRQIEIKGKTEPVSVWAIQGA